MEGGGNWCSHRGQQNQRGGKINILNKKKLFSALYKFYIILYIRKLKKCNYFEVCMFCYRWPL
jgi:hypothetical protein